MGWFTASKMPSISAAGHEPCRRANDNSQREPMTLHFACTAA